MFRYSGNFGQTWTNWTNWENVSIIPSDIVSNPDTWWTGQHIMVQCTLHIVPFLEPGTDL